MKKTTLFKGIVLLIGLALIAMSPTVQRILNANKMIGVFAPINFMVDQEFEKTVAGVVVTAPSTTGQDCLGAEVLSGDCSLTWTTGASGQKLSMPARISDKIANSNTCTAWFTYSYSGDGGANGTFKAYVSVNGTKISQDSEPLLATFSGMTFLQAKGKAFIPSFPCPDKDTANVTLDIERTASVSSFIAIDDVWMTVTTGMLSIPSGSEFFGSLTYAETINCLFGRTGAGSDSYGNFAADTDCPTPAVKGKIIAPGTKIPAVVLPAGSPAGRYFFVASGGFQKTGSGNATVAFRFSDGANSGAGNSVYASGGISALAPTIVGEITYNAALTANTTVNIQGRTINTSNSVNIIADNTTADLQIQVYYYPLSGTYDNVIHAKNMDVPTTTFSTTVSNLGTGSGTVNYAKYAIKGDQGTVCINFTKDGSNGSGGSGVAFSVPTFLAPDTTKMGGSSWAGGGYSSATNSNVAMFMDPSNSLITFSNGSSTITGATLTANSNVRGCVTYPIINRDGQSAPFIKGLVTSNSDRTIRTETARVFGGGTNSACVASPCSTETFASWISSVTRSGAGAYVVNHLLGATPHCDVTGSLSPASARINPVILSITSSAVSLEGSADTQFWITCSAQR